MYNLKGLNFSLAQLMEKPCLSSPLIDLEKSDLKPEVGLGFLWQHPDM